MSHVVNRYKHNPMGIADGVDLYLTEDEYNIVYMALLIFQNVTDSDNAIILAGESTQEQRDVARSKLSNLITDMLRYSNEYNLPLLKEPT